MRQQSWQVFSRRKGISKSARSRQDSNGTRCYCRLPRKLEEAHASGARRSGTAQIAEAPQAPLVLSLGETKPVSERQVPERTSRSPRAQTAVFGKPLVAVPSCPHPSRPRDATLPWRYLLRNPLRTRKGPWEVSRRGFGRITRRTEKGVFRMAAVRQD
jgi:hypothetical protein